MERDYAILVFSVPLLLLSLATCIAGVFWGDVLYARELLSYRAQAVGQDLVTLAVVLPVFIVSAFFACQRNVVGVLLWGGCLFYFFYTYLIYSFGLHFNRFFMVYCMLLGLSLYGFIYFLANYAIHLTAASIKLKGVAVFLYAIAGLFYLLWLSEVIPSILADSIPKSILEAGIMTNPVHIADMAICLPFLILTGVLIQKKKVMGYALTPVALFFCLLLSLAVIGMIVVMWMNGIQTSAALTLIFSSISALSIVLLVRTAGKLKTARFTTT